MLEENLQVVFEGIKDKRSLRNQRHPFLSLVIRKGNGKIIHEGQRLLLVSLLQLRAHHLRER